MIGTPAAPMKFGSASSQKFAQACGMAIEEAMKSQPDGSCLDWGRARVRLSVMVDRVQGGKRSVVAQINVPSRFTGGANF